MKGKFIVIEGPDGAGKSTIANRFFDILKMYGEKVILTREPGGLPAAEDIRKIVKTYKLNQKQQTMLFMASMNLNIEENILPKLEDGYTIICDRYLRSTYIYQGYADITDFDAGINKKKWFSELTKWACNGLLPDLEFVLDVSKNVAWERMHKRNESPDAIESNGRKFLDEINDKYKYTFNNIYGWNYPQYQIDANRCVENVLLNILQIYYSYTNVDIKVIEKILSEAKDTKNE